MLLEWSVCGVFSQCVVALVSVRWFFTVPNGLMDASCVVSLWCFWSVCSGCSQCAVVFGQCAVGVVNLRLLWYHPVGFCVNHRGMGILFFTRIENRV